MRTLRLSSVVPSLAFPLAGVCALALSACTDEKNSAVAAPVSRVTGAPPSSAPHIADAAEVVTPRVEALHDEAAIEELLVVEAAEPEVEPAVAAKSLFDVEALFHPSEGVDYVAEGRRLLEEGKPGEAVSAFRHALYDRDDAGTWANLGEAYRLIDEDDRANACLEEALRKDPASHDVRRSLAKGYLEAGDAEKARGHVEVLARAFPDDASVRYLEGRVYMKLSMWSEAIAALQVSVEKDPRSPWARNNLGFSALMVGQNELAVEHLEAILELEPIKPYMLNNLGIAYERLGRGPDAFAAFLRAVELKPDYTNALVNKERMKRSLSDEEQELARQILEEMKEPAQAASTMASVTSPTTRELE